MTRLSRRAMLGGVATGIAATAGCLGFVTGEKSLTFAAQPADVPRATLERTGYEQVVKRSPSISREFTVAGQTRTVEVTNHLRVYEKDVDLGPMGSIRAATFALLSTPQIQIGPRTFNPIGELSDEQLLKTVASRYEGLSVGARVGTTEVSTLGTTASVARYEATATIQGQSIPIYLLIARVQHGEDFVVPVGGYPRRIGAEREEILRMISAIEHPA